MDPCFDELPQPPIDTQIPLKPPNSSSKVASTTENFKSKLLANEYMADLNMDECASPSEELVLTYHNDLQEIANSVRTIILSREEHKRLHAPWNYSLIIKLLRWHISYQYLKQKIQSLWKPSENFSLINLGLDYDIVKFQKEENMNQVIKGGPWFIHGHYLSLQRCEPNFLPKKSILTYSAVWVHLPQLPTEFYNSLLLKRIVNSIGKLLKIDVCINSTLRGRYARLDALNDNNICASSNVSNMLSKTLHPINGINENPCPPLQTPLQLSNTHHLSSPFRNLNRLSSPFGPIIFSNSQKISKTELEMLPTSLSNFQHLHLANSDGQVAMETCPAKYSPKPYLQETTAHLPNISSYKYM
ncbi:hypothetical protein H5410_040289 [Solanum commersonii]|uniref:DUF4283 domain-containing protein n=1 Tax=Solanum commersonii TaxID=4109 RepID=A0A9J5XQI8_SOLCO|nr:hypothetical protein H5410_040289 [Solanum commersonii]